ncbi:hypothetical protein T484DRAFT_1814405 [Baffinella frigidus]|nr:hypothetical protein T484DRAFT_1814405 [Cryptophyta sp. CCMP2293]
MVVLVGWAFRMSEETGGFPALVVSLQHNRTSSGRRPAVFRVGDGGTEAHVGDGGTEALVGDGGAEALVGDGGTEALCRVLQMIRGPRDLVPARVGDGGTEALCRVLQMIREADLAYTKYLKLFYNDVSDGGAAAITTLLETHARMAGADRRCQVQECHLSHNCITSEGPLECHLSHNCITSEGARRLIVQAERSYPYVDTSGARVPLWLRMEGNLIDPAQLASILPPLCPGNMIDPAQLCPAGEGGCNSKRCALGKNAPFCHLPFIDKQALPRPTPDYPQADMLGPRYTSVNFGA